MNAKSMTQVVIGRDGKPRRKLPSGRTVRIAGRTDWKRLTAMKESAIVAGARNDHNAPPTPRKHVGSFRRVTLTSGEVKAIRGNRGLSQAAFAARYGLNLRTLQDWEQGRVQPDSPARAYLLVILHEPRAVERALATP